MLSAPSSVRPFSLASAPQPVFVPGARPDTDEALRFFAALFGDGGLVHFRSVAEPADGRVAQNHHYELNSSFEETLRGWLEWCEVDQRAAYFLPGLVSPGGTGKDAVISLPAVVVDFDKGDTEANLAAAERAIGPATIVVESGGTTEAGESKLHGYWVFDRAASGPDIDASCAIRLALAERFGGDPAFKQPAQVIRAAGSIWRKKGQPKLVKLRTLRPEYKYTLAGLSAALGCPIKSSAPAGGDFSFDFSNVTPLIQDGHVDRALTQPIHAEGVDDLTRFEGASVALGHFIRMIREGKMTEDEAWEAAKGWNEATLRPAWDEDRLRRDFDRLIDIDFATHGPIVQHTPVLTDEASEGWTIEDWGLGRYARAVPARRWLVDDLIPLGTAGVFAAPGDAGKSMLALRLGYTVACAPVAANDPFDMSVPHFFGQPISARGSVVMLTAEDDEDEITRRLAAIGGGAGSADGRKLLVVPMPSAGGVRAIMTSSPSMGPQQTDFWRELRRQLVAVDNLKLIILDPLSSFVAANLDSDNMAGAALMALLGSLAAETGATVMVLHHFSKGAGAKVSNLGDARSAIRGASSLVDNARWALAMWEVGEDEADSTLKALGRKTARQQVGVVYAGGITKSNAPAVKSRRLLVRDMSTGVLEDCTEVVERSAPRRDETDQKLYATLHEKQMADPRWAFTSSASALNDQWGPVVRKLGLNITKDGKGKGSESMRAVFDRWLDCGMVVEIGGGRYQIALDMPQ